MPYKTFVIEDGLEKREVILDLVMIKILENADTPLTTPQIEKIFDSPPYKNKIKGTNGKLTNITRIGIRDILKRLKVKGEIENVAFNGKLAWKVNRKSKILAEFNGILFGDMFGFGMFHQKSFEKHIKEFESSKHKKTRLDALMQIFGFVVLGSLLASRLYYKDTRSDWLKPVLDLENRWKISKIFDSLIVENNLEYLLKDLTDKYPENMDVLKRAFGTSKKMKEAIEKNEDYPVKRARDFIKITGEDE